MSQGPLSETAPHEVNYRLQGPPHRLMLTDFPRRIRAVFREQVAIDTVRGKLLHETGALPVVLVHRDDVAADLRDGGVGPAEDPFKGPATALTMSVGEATAEGAARAFEDPPENAAWLRGYLAFDWAVMDAWFDEDEEVRGHLRDPFHRVDVRASSRLVRVSVAGELIAESQQGKVLSETGLANRIYVPREDVRPGVLSHSTTREHCPYKGDAVYWTLRVAGATLVDAAWSYPQPLESAFKIPDHLSFDHEELRVEVEGPRSRPA